MKKLLLFLALWSGVACAMQADTMPMGGICTTPIQQDSSALVSIKVDQASGLTQAEQHRAVVKATKNLQEIMKACRNDKELMKKMLIQRVKNLMNVACMDKSIDCVELHATTFTCNVLLTAGLNSLKNFSK